MKIKKSDLLNMIQDQNDVIAKLIRQVNCHHEDIVRLEGIVEPEPQLIAIRSKRDISKELLEIDLSSELTGSELCKAMINKNDWVLAYVSDENDATAEFHQRPAIVTGATIDGRFKCGEITWRFAVPINNQGEPLTAAEVGL